MTQAVRAPFATRFLERLSWLSLGGAVLTAVTALFCPWGVNAESLGAHDAGVALSFSWIGAVVLVGSFCAVPVLTALGVVSLFLHRRTGFRFLAAGAVTALPLAVLTWLER